MARPRARPGYSPSQRGRAPEQRNEQLAQVQGKIGNLVRGFETGIITVHADQVLALEDDDFHVALFQEPEQWPYESRDIFVSLEKGGEGGSGNIDVGVYTAEEVTAAGFTARLAARGSVMGITNGQQLFCVPLDRPVSIIPQRKLYFVGFRAFGLSGEDSDIQIGACDADTCLNGGWQGAAGAFAELPTEWSHKAGPNTLQRDTQVASARFLSQVGRRVLCD
jgi:hypothetical protein